jgi:hypothetical protein
MSSLLFRLTILYSAPLLAIAAGNTFLAASKEGLAGSSEEDFRAAMATVMGCGAGSGSSEGSKSRLPAVERAIQPMWRVLPKNPRGLVEWRMVRYLAHRYFTQQSSLLVRGFEPMRQVNSSDLGSADILSAKGSSTVGALLESKQSSEGFSLEEAASMIATLEQLIFNAETSLLEAAYAKERKSTVSALSHAELSRVMEVYMVHWMIGDDPQAIRLLLANRTLLQQVLPKWNDVKGFVDGIVKNMEYAAQHNPKAGYAQAAMNGMYSFKDAHNAVGDITRTFASFWESECQMIKGSLVELDKRATGRVSLKDFYGANADGEWRFGESEAYLRELGALDESSPWLGKQVIIPNYLQGASNCIVSTKHYLVCCAHECEPILNEIEDAVGTPVAPPEQILPLVGNMTTLDDEPPKIDEALKAQLQRIADMHGGKVPLHGRLFAQWLHYVFPRECPFPHKSGAHKSLSPQQYGQNYIASDAEVKNHAALRNESTPLLAEHEEAQWMSQWSEEEELIADYSLQLSAPWELHKRPFMLGGASCLVALIVMAMKASTRNSKKSSEYSYISAFDSKSHFV